MSEGLTIAVVAGIFGVLAGVPAAISAAMTSRTRKVAEKQAAENTAPEVDAVPAIDDLNIEGVTVETAAEATEA